MCGECNWKPVYIDPEEPLNENIVEGLIPRRWITKEEGLKMFPKENELNDG